VRKFPRFHTAALLLLLAGVALAAEEAATPVPLIPLDALKPGQVRVEIFEFAPKAAEAAEEPVVASNDSGDTKGKSKTPVKDEGDDATFAKLPPEKTEEYSETAFAFSQLPAKFNERGIRIDRSRPFLVRAAAVVTLPSGENKLLLRALTGSRISIDGREIGKTAQLRRKGGDAEAVPDQLELQLMQEMHLLAPGHKESMATVQGDGTPHVVTLEAFVGGKGSRPEVGELTVSISHAGEPFRLLSPTQDAPQFTDGGWRAFADAQRIRVAELEQTLRHNTAEEAYWTKRHEIARAAVKPVEGQSIDAFIAAGLKKAGAMPAPLSDDAAFIRRVHLDLTGELPTASEASAFLKDSSADKRAKLIDQLLQDRRWADRWTPYWQDVLAENPAMLKATLSNTGPFRWWIHDALVDNKPMDRFVTELVQMEGSAQYGGPAGFAVSSQNDLPMAAKAQIVSSAFMAMEMKCARCHDAPNHPFNQEDLFNLAAMLQRAPVKVPESSLTKGLSTNSRVVVSLKAGQVVDAHWPFKDSPAEPLRGIVRKPGDSREQLAAILTDPRNPRFAQVVVNRLWKELIGLGIVEPVDDWENSSPSHPELMAWLGHELVTHGYDLKHVARLILNSETYQRAVTAAGSKLTKEDERTFAAPARRRMRAEQLVDSLYQVAGKAPGCEMLTMDPEDRQPDKDHTNLGSPKKAWEFTGLSNERDRPALAKPRAQVVTDVLATFGWREARAEPRSARDHDANVLQPALLANGDLGARVVRLSDDHAVTALALQQQPVETLIDQVFLRVLSRRPSANEAARYTELLRPGYEQRLTGAAALPPPRGSTKAVSWANHLNAAATKAILDVEKEVHAGDPATPRLQPAWRERMEDMLWSLIVSPEFIYLP
jgi:hypothetical protein